MGLSYENKALLSVRLGRVIGDDTRVTLTGRNLGRLLDAARKEERETRPEPSVFEQVFGAETMRRFR